MKRKRHGENLTFKGELVRMKHFDEFVMAVQTPRQKWEKLPRQTSYDLAPQIQTEAERLGFMLILNAFKINRRKEKRDET